MGINIPVLLPYGLPTIDDFSIALLILALPQIPMTVGNAVIANADLSAQYFPRDGKRVTYKALCISMALGNLGSFFLGGMPLCHGAGGLASRYRFGARTAGSNVIIGGIFLLLGLVFGSQTIVIINTIPLSVLGVLLVFAGTQLALTILDITTRKDFFVILLILRNHTSLKPGGRLYRRNHRRPIITMGQADNMRVRLISLQGNSSRVGSTGAPDRMQLRIRSL